MIEKKPKEGDKVRVYDGYHDTWYEGIVANLLSSMFTYDTKEMRRLAFYRDKWEIINDGK